MAILASISELRRSLVPSRASSENRPAKRPESGAVIETHEHAGDFKEL
jgi:hypothetical protein